MALFSVGVESCLQILHEILFDSHVDEVAIWLDSCKCLLPQLVKFIKLFYVKSILASSIGVLSHFTKYGEFLQIPILQTANHLNEDMQILQLWKPISQIFSQWSCVTLKNHQI